MDDAALDNTFIHLTNFTVNKAGQTVEDYPPGCQVRAILSSRMPGKWYTAFRIIGKCYTTGRQLSAILPSRMPDEHYTLSRIPGKCSIYL